jgi:hypothetical protein
MSSEGPAGIGVGASVEKDESVAGPLGGRGLTLGEVTLLRGVFHDAIDYRVMRVRKGSLLTVAAAAVTLDNLVSFNPDGYFEDYTSAPRVHQAIFVHEGVHVWQYQRKVRDYRWPKAAWEHLRHGPAAYDYVLDRRKALTDYRFEQMGQIVQDFFLLSPEDPERAAYEEVISRSIPRPRPG